MTREEFVKKWGSRLREAPPDTADYVAWCLFYTESQKHPFLSNAELIECARDWILTDRKSVTATTEYARHLIWDRCYYCRGPAHVDYMLKDEIWLALGMKKGSMEGVLCLDCANTRLGRKLTSNDFQPFIINEKAKSLLGLNDEV